MLPDAIAKRALRWLLRRNKRVGNHIALHNSRKEAAAVTRPWILRKAAHSILIGGDAVTKKVCEKTLQDCTHVVRQGSVSVYTRVFGRRIGRGVNETAFKVVVENATGAIITGYAITATAAVATIGPFILLDKALKDTIDALNVMHIDYATNHPPREEGWVEKIADFFMDDLGNTAVDSQEHIYLRENRIALMQEQKFLASVEDALNRYLTFEEKLDLRNKFHEGIAGAAAPYVEDQG